MSAAHQADSQEHHRMFVFLLIFLSPIMLFIAAYALYVPDPCQLVDQDTH